MISAGPERASEGYPISWQNMWIWGGPSPWLLMHFVHPYSLWNTLECWWMCCPARTSEKHFKALPPDPILHLLSTCLIFLLYYYEFNRIFQVSPLHLQFLVLYSICYLTAFPCLLPLVMTRWSLRRLGVPHKVHQPPQTYLKHYLNTSVQILYRCSFKDKSHFFIYLIWAIWTFNIVLPSKMVISGKTNRLLIFPPFWHSVLKMFPHV